MPLAALLLGALLANSFIYEDPEADRLIRQTMDATYAMRLTAAREGARALQERYPDHPAGYLLMAETYWWEAQADRGNPAIEDAYYEAHELAEEKAEAAVEAARHPRTELLAYLASVHGSYARFQVTQKEAFFGAMRAGLRAHRYARQVHELDPEYLDIYVGLGAFNYFTGSLPAVLKPFAFLVGARGNKETGFEQLRIAREESRYSRTEARIVSYTALLEDKQYEAAWEMVQGLRRDYPTNPVLFVWITDWYLRQGRIGDAIAHYEQIAARELDSRPRMAQFALLEKAQLENRNRRTDLARITLERIREVPIDDPLLARRVAAIEARLND